MERQVQILILYLLNYFFFRIFTGLIGLMPFPFLYKLSDALALCLRKIMKYRREVIEQNLRNSFPKKSDKEINDLITKSYHNLADVILEGIKGFSMSPDTSNARYKWLNPELTDQYFKQGKHVIGLASHYGNWEWGTQTIGHQLMHRTLGIVKLVKNPYINKYLQSKRCAKNVFVADISKTKESIEAFQDEPTLFIFISDQGPRNIEKAQWVDFLNQKTPCLYGADRLAREKDWPVINVKVERIKRGYYEIEMELLSDQSSNTLDGELTSAYMKSLERQIIAKPENWLWSHRRWKRAKMRSS